MQATCFTPSIFLYIITLTVLHKKKKIWETSLMNVVHRHNLHSFQYYPQHPDTSMILPRGRQTKFHSHTENDRIKFLFVFSSSDLWGHVGVGCQRLGGKYCLLFKARGFTFLRKAESRLSHSNSVSRITEAQHRTSPALPSIMIHYEIYDKLLREISSCISFYVVDIPYNFKD